MSCLETSVVALYLATLLILALFGCHRLYLLRLYDRSRARARCPAGCLDPLPRVTVQLPVYNEVYVVERLIRAASALDYPADRLEIQVLDDSDDETSALAGRVIGEMRARGHDVAHLRRVRRDGFKAGALAHGLRLARGELIAVFDADFVPPPGFLLELIDHFSHPRVGMVQARWGHLNRDYSLLTRVQSIFLDGHFVIEHAARHRSGLFFNFNGTAGIWRRSCIESAGGWQADTLTEDLDLSYRAQLAGWEFVFVPEVVAPAELPADIDAFRSQQRRWARGSIETARKILPRLLRAPLPLGVKIEAAFHLTGNAAYALMVVLAILMVPAMALRRGAGLETLLLLDLPLVLLSSVSVALFYVRSQRDTRDDWASCLRLVPLLMSLGVGLSLNNGRAVVAALRGRRAEFVRTPKHDLRGTIGDWRGKLYRAPGGGAWAALEILFALYFTAAIPYAFAAGLYASLPVIALFQSGFLYVSILSLAQVIGRRFSPKGASRTIRGLGAAPGEAT